MAKQKHGRGTRVAGPPIVLLVLVMAGCAAPSEMTDVWKDPSIAADPMRNVLVVALRKDPVRRRMWEDAFARELGARGLTATSSYQLFQEAAPDTEQVIEAVRTNGYDAVLVSIRLPTQTTSTYVPGAVRREIVTTQNFYGIFHTYWRDVQDPGHVETDAITRVQTDVWATGTRGRLIWSGTLRTFESVSDRTVETSVSKDILPVLEKQGLIPRAAK